MLALEADGSSLAYVVADLYEIRAAGEERATARSLPLRVRRLLRRELPTAGVTEIDPADRRLERAFADVPRVRRPKRLLPFRVLRDAYPEATLFAPTGRLRRLARIAVTAAVRGNLPPRTYAKTPRH